MKKNIWRLSTSPTVDEVLKLVEAGIIKKEDAKDIIFREEEKVKESSLKDVRDEIKLLRELVLRLSEKNPTYVFPIIERYHYTPWYKPYEIWCSSNSGTGNITNGSVTFN